MSGEASPRTKSGLLSHQQNGVPSEHTSPSSKIGSSEKTHHRVRKDALSSPHTKLAIIRELGLSAAGPSVTTVERAAAAKIFLEIHFNGLLSNGANPKSIRRQLLEADIYNLICKRNISSTQQGYIRSQFYSRETQHLRDTRVLKAQSILALGHRFGEHAGSPADNYEIVKILGKGSFGVVRLVREKVHCGQANRNATHGSGDDSLNDREKQVYAMKVIRKSDMLRTSQEAHLRAERDFLVASQGSNWWVGVPFVLQDVCG